MQSNRLNILVVEDNTGDFLLIQEMLHAIKGFKKDIRHVNTLQEAVQEINQQIPDVILLDLSLPDSYGIDSFTHLNDYNSSIPILILSGLNDTTFAHDAVKDGAQDYLVKGDFEENLLAKSILYSIERKASMELLKQSQSSYKLLFESNPIPMYIRNSTDFSIIKANQSAVDHFGYSEKELLEMKVFDLHPADEVEYLRSIISESSGSSGKSTVLNHICKNGDIIIVECRSQQIMIDGEPCMLVLADDITEKRRVQNEALFQAGILENVRDTIFVTDKNGIITYWNEGAELNFGYSKDEIIGENYQILYSEIDKLSVKQEHKEVLSENLQQWEARLISKKATIVWCDIKASLLLNEQDDIIGVIRVCKDVTQSRYYSEKQKETVAMLNSIFNNVNQSVLLIDKDMRLKAFNTNAVKHYIQLLGTELQENKSVSDYLLLDIVDEFTQKFKESLEGNIVQWELAYRFTPTSIKWFSINMSPVSDDSDSVLGVCASLLDITERKEADEKFKGQYEEIESNNKELDRLVKILSHDLKAPMNSVKGLISLAKEVKNPDEFGQYLGMMDKSLVQLETFTNDIIASLKNRGVASKQEVGLKNLIDEVVDELRFAEGGNRMKFINTLDPELTIRSDSALLRSIFTNLISNAIKYQDVNKPDPFVEISSSQFPMIIEIEVKDNGIGISQENQGKIFDQYFTIHNRPDSNGIGLSNVREAVLKLNGSIALESSIDEGSVFKIQIPLS